MPVTIKTAAIEYKSPTTGEYIGVDAIETGSGSGVADLSSIAPNYNDLIFPVAKGQLCYYENVLYKAKQNIPTSEDWTSAHWDEKTIDEILGEIDTRTYGISVDSFSKYNIMSSDRIKTGTVRDVVITKNDDVFTFNGTASGSDSMECYPLDLIPGEKYTIRMYTESSKATNCTVRYKVGSTETSLGSFGTTSNNRTLTFTCPATFDKIYVKIGVTSGVIYSGDEFRISIAVGEINPEYVKYGEGVSAFDGYARYCIEQLNKNLKEYETFVTPEQFGAVGDDTADDTGALNACISYANTNNKNIIGMGRYRVSSGITLNCENKYIYLHKLYSYSDISALLTVMGSYNTIIVNFLSCASYNIVGLKISSSSTVMTMGNNIDCRRIVSRGKCILFEGDTNYVSYNTINLGIVYSTNDNAIECGVYATENYLYNASVRCPNGWAIYDPHTLKCMNFALENLCKNGIYLKDGSAGMFLNFRHIELTDVLVNRMQFGLQTEGGTLIKIVGPYHDTFVYEGQTYIPYQAIDTSEYTDYTDPTIDIDPPTQYYPVQCRFNNNTRKSYIRGGGITNGQYSTQCGGFPIGEQMVIISGKKICKPVMDSVYTVETASVDMRDNYVSDDNNYPYATRFIIGVANCVIHLAPSYCCIGYDSFTVDQTDPSKLCTIYNSYDPDTPIFNGETLGAGVYTVKCMCDIEKASEQIPGAQNYFYTGRNDMWIVTNSSGTVVSTYRYTTQSNNL